MPQTRRALDSGEGLAGLIKKKNSGKDHNRSFDSFLRSNSLSILETTANEQFLFLQFGSKETVISPKIRLENGVYNFTPVGKEPSKKLCIIRLFLLFPIFHKLLCKGISRVQWSVSLLGIGAHFSWLRRKFLFVPWQKYYELTEIISVASTKIVAQDNKSSVKYAIKRHC